MTATINGMTPEIAHQMLERKLEGLAEVVAALATIKDWPARFELYASETRDAIKELVSLVKSELRPTVERHERHIGELSEKQNATDNEIARMRRDSEQRFAALEQQIPRAVARRRKVRK